MSDKPTPEHAAGIALAAQLYDEWINDENMCIPFGDLLQGRLREAKSTAAQPTLRTGFRILPEAFLTYIDDWRQACMTARGEAQDEQILDDVAYWDKRLVILDTIEKMVHVMPGETDQETLLWETLSRGITPESAAFLTKSLRDLQQLLADALPQESSDETASN